MNPSSSIINLEFNPNCMACCMLTNKHCKFHWQIAVEEDGEKKISHQHMVRCFVLPRSTPLDQSDSRIQQQEICLILGGSFNQPKNARLSSMHFGDMNLVLLWECLAVLSLYSVKLEWRKNKPKELFLSPLMARLNRQGDVEMLSGCFFNTRHNRVGEKSFVWLHWCNSHLLSRRWRPCFILRLCYTKTAESKCRISPSSFCTLDHTEDCASACCEAMLSSPLA